MFFYSTCSIFVSSAPSSSSSGPQVLRAPLRHRWRAGAGPDAHPWGQAVLQEPGWWQREIQGARGVRHQRWELHEADQSWASVPSAGCGGKLNVFIHFNSSQLCLFCVFKSFSLHCLYRRCLQTRWCCPTVLCECLPSSIKSACWCRDRVLWRRSLTSILLSGFSLVWFLHSRSMLTFWKCACSVYSVYFCSCSTLLSV